jgi:subtilase family serine protease
MRLRPLHLALVALALILTACTSTSGSATATATPSATAVAQACPAELAQDPQCLTPGALRAAYGVQPLIDRRFTGKGQTIIDIVSFGSPTLQQDMDVFDKQFGLPPITIQVIAPLGTVPFDPTNVGMSGWAGETELDVQIIHAIAPDANIVVMTSPVNETEGTVGLPEFMKLEQYAVSHHLGQIFSQSWSVSEATLQDSASQQFIKSYASFYQQISTQQGFTVLSGSGDLGATDCGSLDCIGASGQVVKLAPTRTVNFPVDTPWVTAVGGTTLTRSTSGYDEVAWPGSGGGASQFFAEPSFQQGLPQAAQSELGRHRGLPDVAADADPATGLAFYINGHWAQVGGTSASTPLWAGIVAIADQMAGHGLGNINPGLYKLGQSATAPQDFRDITSGDNSNSSDGVNVQGFQAVAGWDAVTGWGVPLASHLVPDLIAALR